MPVDMNSEDGQIFIRNLALFVKTHEKALANALNQNQRHQSRENNDTRSNGLATHNNSPSSASASASASASSSISNILPLLGLGSRAVKPAKLTLTPHHLWYLLSRFQELGVSVGPLDVRLENIHSDTTHGNYVSFLSQTQRSRVRSPDHDSIHSVSSVRSVMSSMSSLWTKLGLSGRAEAKTEKLKLQVTEDLTYLYSCFTKVPSLRFCPDHKAPLIAGYEEFPFDSAVPLTTFKNVTTLEICDIDFRQFYGWDRLAEQLRSLTIKRGQLDDPSEVLVSIVLDDIDRRRKRSAKTPPSPLLPWSAPSPVLKHADLATSLTSDGSLIRPISVSGSSTLALSSTKKPVNHSRQRSLSPTRPAISRQNSTLKSTLVGGGVRRSSMSSESTDQANTPRGSASNLLSFSYFPINKWRFLRHLSLSDNGLTIIPALSLAPVAATLQFLDLSHNLITEVPEGLSSLVALRAIDLSHCMLASVHSLIKHPLPAITTFNLRGNRLTSLAGIERLFSLERIDLRENKLSDPVEIARLTGIPNMTDIYVNRNLFTRTHLDYRVTIFNLFRKVPGHTDDIMIDGKGPASHEKRLLVDRTVETAAPPVEFSSPLEASVENDQINAVPVTSILVLDALPQGEVPAVPARRKSQRTSQRRKRMSRRRVVEIAHEEQGANAVAIPEQSVGALQKKSSRTDDSTYGGSIDATSSNMAREHTLRSIVAVDDEQVLAPEAVSTALPIQVPIDQSKPLPALPSSPSASSGKSNKIRIESLRQDLGSAWLSALTDDTWDTQSSPSAPTIGNAAHSCLRLDNPSAPVRSMSQAIISTGGTVGH